MRSKKLTMKRIIRNLGVGLSFFNGLQAMEVDCQYSISKNQEATKMIFQDEIVYKTWLLEQAGKDCQINLHKDIQNLIFQIFMCISDAVSYANPILDCSLIYSDKGKKEIFKIGNLIKLNGRIDLSNQVFKELSKNLLMTIDPKVFFHIVQGSNRFVVLFSTKAFIQEKISSSAAPFRQIVSEWTNEQASFGIFYRCEGWMMSSRFDYLINIDSAKLSSKNLYEWWPRVYPNHPRRIPLRTLFPHPILTDIINQVSCFHLRV